MATIRGSGRHSRRTSKDSGGFWISFSDLMSSLLLIFILIMFYIMYQYFDMYEVNMAEIARQQFDLDQANATLTQQQATLADQQEKLTAAEQAMIAQQIKLNAAQEDLDSAEAILAAQQEELAEAQSLLDEKEDEVAAQKEQLDALSVQLGTQATQIATQQQQIDAQKDQLENQQQQIEQLVGVRTRLITDLSTALKSANISAAVDPANGAITLESSVLFPTDSSTLSEAGKRRIDAFLPVYLNVLFSDEYKDYISEVIIEGHTDSDGGYQSNLILSQRRALSVASYVLDDSYHGISSAQKTLLRRRATVNGRSYMDRIMVNGIEDKDASRRVVFKFRLTDEEMIAQMQAILEENGETPTVSEAAPPVTPEAGAAEPEN